jgi:hypothetical protein
MAWHGDIGVGDPVGAKPGSIAEAVLVCGADAIARSTSAPGTARDPAGSDWANTVPGAAACDAGGTAW